MAEIVIREVTTGVVTFSGPFKRMGVFPIGGRSTACKLSDGSVFLLASTPLSPETKSKIDELGEVKTIACGDFVHTMFLKSYCEAYPSARLIGPEGLAQKSGLKCTEYSGDDAKDKDVLGTGVIAQEMQAEYFKGFVNKDIAFLHKPSKTLIEADLLFNLPPNEQYSKSKEAPTNFLGKFLAFNPQAAFHKRFLYSLGAKDKAAMAKSASVVDGWDFERIIPCHGDVIEQGAKAAWRSAYEYYFKDIEAGKLKGAPST